MSSCCWQKMVSKSSGANQARRKSVTHHGGRVIFKRLPVPPSVFRRLVVHEEAGDLIPQVMFP